jgi:hypothetical protein
MTAFGWLRPGAFSGLLVRSVLEAVKMIGYLFPLYDLIDLPRLYLTIFLSLPTYLELLNASKPLLGKT